MEIRKVTPNESSVLLKLALETFEHTYKAKNTAENFKAYVDANFTQAILEAELHSPVISYYFLWLEDRPIGYLKLREKEAQGHDFDNAIEIERIYVHYDFHGKGYGKKLIQKASAIAKEKQKSFVWLGVWDQNPKAIQFYVGQGYKIFDIHIFWLGQEKQFDFLMRHFVG